MIREGTFGVVRGEETVTVSYQAEQRGMQWVVMFDSSRNGAEQHIGADAFDALLALRGPWEADGWAFLVNRARTNAWPSGMARENGGFVIYLEDERRIATGQRVEAVDTFGPCAAELVGTVAEQERHHESFLGRARQ